MEFLPITYPSFIQYLSDERTRLEPLSLMNQKTGILSFKSDVFCRQSFFAVLCVCDYDFYLYRQKREQIKNGTLKGHKNVRVFHIDHCSLFCSLQSSSSICSELSFESFFQKDVNCEWSTFRFKSTVLTICCLMKRKRRFAGN